MQWLLHFRFFFSYIRLCWGNTSWSSLRSVIECLQFLCRVQPLRRTIDFPFCLDFSGTLLPDDWEQAVVKRGGKALVFHKSERKCNKGLTVFTRPEHDAIDRSEKDVISIRSGRCGMTASFFLGCRSYLFYHYFQPSWAFLS